MQIASRKRYAFQLAIPRDALRAFFFTFFCCYRFFISTFFVVGSFESNWVVVWLL